jgi:cell division protein FtsW (lipid II flippase)
MTYFYKQSTWFLLSLVSLFSAFYFIDLKKIRKLIFPLLLLVIILLIFTLKFGIDVNGARRTIRILGISFQPSLLARIVLIIYFAHFLDKKKSIISKTYPLFFVKKFLVLLVVTTIIFLLILLEKHFSFIVISGLTLIWLLFLAQIRGSSILSLITLALILGMLVITFGPKYRSNRIDIYKKWCLFFNHSTTQKIDGEWQIKQSLQTLSDGKLLGTGTTKGIGKYNFLPEDRTDYIFAIIGEEWGFLGASFVMLIFSFLFARTLINANRQDNFFLKLVGFGLGMNIFFNAIVNIGVAMSALPSTGVTLPFISYGGTSLLINSFTIGLLLNVSKKRRIL